MSTLKRARLLLALLSCNAYANWTESAFPEWKVTPMVSEQPVLTEVVTVTIDLKSNTNSIPTYSLESRYFFWKVYPEYDSIFDAFSKVWGNWRYFSNFIVPPLATNHVVFTNSWTTMTLYYDAARSNEYLITNSSLTARTTTNEFIFGDFTNKVIAVVNTSLVRTNTTLMVNAQQQRLIEYYNAAMERSVSWWGGGGGGGGGPLRRNYELFRIYVWLYSRFDHFMKPTLLDDEGSMKTAIEGASCIECYQGRRKNAIWPLHWNALSLTAYLGIPENYFGSTTRIDPNDPSKIIGYAEPPSRISIYGYYLPNYQYGGHQYFNYSLMPTIVTSLVFTITATNWNDPDKILPEQRTYDIWGRATNIIGASGTVFRLVTTNEAPAWVTPEWPAKSFITNALSIQPGFTSADYGERHFRKIFDQLYVTTSAGEGLNKYRTARRYYKPNIKVNIEMTLEIDRYNEFAHYVEQKMLTFIDDYLADYPFFYEFINTDVERISEFCTMTSASSWRNSKDELVWYYELHPSGQDVVADGSKDSSTYDPETHLLTITGLVVYADLPVISSKPAFATQRKNTPSTVELYSRVVVQVPQATLDVESCFRGYDWWRYGYWSQYSMVSKATPDTTETFIRRKISSATYNETANRMVANGINGILDMGFILPHGTGYELARRAECMFYDPPGSWELCDPSAPTWSVNWKLADPWETFRQFVILWDGTANGETITLTAFHRQISNYSLPGYEFYNIIYLQPEFHATE